MNPIANSPTTSCEFPIDAVITWVDGNDPLLNAKRKMLLPAKLDDKKLPEMAAPTRFDSQGEIYWCVASLLKYAPFLRKIYIVTDGQDPHIEDNLGPCSIPVEIVDHSVIFRGYEEHLPTFCSLSIETMLWRIPGLSDKFVYLNDDFMLTAPVTPADWFDPTSGAPRVFGYRHNTLTAAIAGRASDIFHGRRQFSFRNTMLNAALLLGGSALWNFVRIQHLPLPLDRTLYENYFSEHPEAIIRNIKYRFRDPHQYNPQELNNLLAIRLLGSKIVDHSAMLITMGPEEDAKFRRKLARLCTDPQIKYLCIESLDLIHAEQRKALMTWLETAGIKRQI